VLPEGKPILVKVDPGLDLERALRIAVSRNKEARAMTHSLKKPDIVLRRTGGLVFFIPRDRTIAHDLREYTGAKSTWLGDALVLEEGREVTLVAELLTIGFYVGESPS
jgi:hypothetical protein